MLVTIKIVLGIAGIVVAALSALLIIVDGVAIMFTYASLVLALFSVGLKNRRILKIYGVVFVIAHVILGWRIYSDTNNNDYYSSGSLPNFDCFERCSNRLRQGRESAALRSSCSKADAMRSISACIRPIRAGIKESMITQMIIGIGNKNIEDNMSPQRMHILFRAGIITAQRIDKFQITV